LQPEEIFPPSSFSQLDRSRSRRLFEPLESL
jgi:hypothetical protein